MKNLMLFLLLCFALVRVQAQAEKELLAQLDEEEKEAIEALVMYPEDTRLAILECSRYPEALIKIGRLQANTSAAFEQMLREYPESTQKTVWELARYPGLIAHLVEEGQGSGARIRAILENYPEAVHEEAMKGGTQHYPLLKQAHELERSAERAFEHLMAEYPPDIRTHLQSLLDLPEVLSLLNENIELTILVGDVYARDPEWVLEKADSIGMEVARANAQELEDWKAELENNPEAVEELKASAEEYAEEYGYDDEYYPYPNDDLYYDESEDSYVVEHHYYYHYPYWFGYPYWYTYPRWRPYPYWYDWGFYFRPSSAIVVIRLPSLYFTNWYFYHPHHHYRYPRLSAHFVRHYRYHPRPGSSITVSVRDWQSRNRTVISRDWLEDGQRLPERFREYGKFEMERQKHNASRPDRQLSQRDYLQRHTNRYPRLAENAPSEREIYREPAYRPPTRPPVAEPDPRPRMEPRPRTDDRDKVTRPRTPTDTRDKERVTRPRTEPQERERVITPPRRPVPRTEPRTEPRTRQNIPQIEKGKEHHKNTWKKPEPQTRPRTTPSRTRPQPRTQPVPKTQPRKKSSGDTRRKSGEG